jgi:spore maturation protein CgeB
LVRKNFDRGFAAIDFTSDLYNSKCEVYFSNRGKGIPLEYASEGKVRITMKVMITTTKRPDTLATYYTKYLSCIAGIELFPVYTFDKEEQYIQESFLQKVRTHFLPGALTKLISNYLEEEIHKSKPDVLIIIKGMYIGVDLIRRAKEQGVFLVNYNPDHPLYFETRASGNSNITNAVPYYDLMFTYSPLIAKQLQEYFPRLRTTILPFGYEESKYNTNEISSNSLIKKLCFAGTADRTRGDFISSLIKSKVYVDVYGRGYSKYIHSDSAYLRLFPEVSGEDYLYILQRYAVALNLYRTQNVGSHNMRSFEIPAVGGIQLVEYSEQMNGIFKNRSEVFLYKTSTELQGVISDVLNYSDQNLLEMKNTIRDKTLGAHFSYKDRAQQMIEVIRAYM